MVPPTPHPTFQHLALGQTFFFYRPIQEMAKHLLSPFTKSIQQRFIYSKFHKPGTILVTGETVIPQTVSCPQWSCSENEHANRSIPISVINTVIETCVCSCEGRWCDFCQEACWSLGRLPKKGDGILVRL